MQEHPKSGFFVLFSPGMKRSNMLLTPAGGTWGDLFLWAFLLGPSGDLMGGSSSLVTACALWLPCGSQASCGLSSRDIVGGKMNLKAWGKGDRTLGSRPSISFSCCITLGE